MSNETLEKVFALIEKANALHDDKKLWEAAETYTEARLLLVELGNSATAANNDEAPPDAAQLQTLYRQQARDYLHQARASLIEALKTEDDADRQVQHDQPTRHEQECYKTNNDNNNNNNNNNTSDAETKKNSKEEEEEEGNDESATSPAVSLERLRLFARLFSNEEALQKSFAKNSNVVEQQSSLEERFRALNASLPQGVKSSEQRMREINQGMNKLGVSTVSHSDRKHQELFEVGQKSESDMVEDIIAQAKDEASLMGTQKQPLSSLVDDADKDDIPSSGPLSADDLVDNMTDAVAAARSKSKADGYDDKSDDDNDSATNENEDDDDVDAFNNDDSPFLPSDIAFFQDRVTEAQALLAEFNAMLGTTDDDDDDDAGLLFDAETGKHTLNKALAYLKEIQQKWKEAKKRST